LYHEFIVKSRHSFILSMQTCTVQAYMKKINAFLTFIASTMQTSPYNAQALFCKNNNLGVMVELTSPISRGKGHPNLLKKHMTQ